MLVREYNRSEKNYRGRGNINTKGESRQNRQEGENLSTRAFLIPVKPEVTPRPLHSQVNVPAPAGSAKINSALCSGYPSPLIISLLKVPKKPKVKTERPCDHEAKPGIFLQVG